MSMSHTTADSKNVQLGKHTQNSNLATVYGLKTREAKGVISSAKQQDWLWSPSSLLFNGHWCSFPEVKQLGHDAYHSLPS